MIYKKSCRIVKYHYYSYNITIRQKFKSLEASDISLHNLIVLETVFISKIDNFKEIISDNKSNSFSSLVRTMQEEQQIELDVLQYVILLITRIKQEFCNHPKKDNDNCDGKLYCMNCNYTLEK